MSEHGSDIVIDARLAGITAGQPYPLLFATVSGAHLYGFPSPDSDWDLRGVHLLPAAEVVSLRPARETVEVMWDPADHDGLELDLVTHDLAKFARLLLRPNGYVLEQLTSPLVVHTTPAHAALCDLVPELLTSHHAHHYRGFAHTQWKLFAKESPPRVKPLLYVYRVLLTGIHLMRAGVLEANLAKLIAADPAGDRFHLAPLIDAKRGGAEQSRLEADAVERHRANVELLHEELAAAQDATALPETPRCTEQVEEWVVRWRLDGLPS